MRGGPRISSAAREMREGRTVRILLSAALLLATSGCGYYSPAPWGWTPGWTPAPGQLALSNYRFDHAAVEAIVTPSPDCAAVDPAVGATAFDLPFKGTRVVVATPNADICWRRHAAGEPWTEWNRAFTSSGRFVDSQL